MAATINNTINRIFRKSPYYDGHLGIIKNRGCYLEIPIDKELFELPCFAVNSFCNLVDNGNYEKTSIMAVELKIGKVTPYYKTFNRNMLDYLITSVKNGLSDIAVDYRDRTRTYYVSQGLVLNETLSPIFTCSWQLAREKQNNEYYFHIIKPIIRVSPGCYVAQEDAMQKYISKKIPSSALKIDIQKITTSLNKIKSYGFSIPSFIVERSPFSIKFHSEPSIHIKNEEVWQVVKDHINEAIII